MNGNRPLGLDTFTTGATRYADQYNHEKTTRIVITVHLINYSEPIEAIVDTGAPWCVLNPLVFEKVAPYAEPLYILDSPLNIRGLTYRGWLYRLPIRLEASIGESFDVMGIVFVPDLSPNEEWYYPNFIGLDGFLNRIRFAVYPDSNLFFFGALG